MAEPGGVIRSWPGTIPECRLLERPRRLSQIAGSAPHTRASGLTPGFGEIRRSNLQLASRSLAPRAPGRRARRRRRTQLLEVRWTPRFRGRRALLLVAVAVLVAVVVGIAMWSWLPWWPRIHVTGPGPTGQRISDGEIFANYYPAHADGRGPAVLLLGGSEGGIGKGLAEEATAMQSAGLSVVALGYFGVPGQPPTLERVPLETFDRALAWLAGRHEVDPQRISIFGSSKGAEAGVNPRSLDPESSWTLDGHPLPALPYGRLRPSMFLGHIAALYRDGLKRLPRHPTAVIPVEKIKSTVLLVCGEKDSLWPSCEMARQVEQRAEQSKGAHVTVLAYNDAGHYCIGVPLSPKSSDFGSLSRWGGTTEGNNTARVDGWPKIIDLLRG